jgi:hypothetical protein
MVPIRQEQREGYSVYDEIAEKSEKKEEHKGTPRPITSPAHGIPFVTANP